MPGAVLAVAVAVALALSGAVADGGAPGHPAVGPLVPDVPSAQNTAAITLTTVNWGQPVSLRDPEHLGWGHLAPQAGPTDVTARIELRGQLVHDWVASLVSDSAFGGVQPADCRGSEEAAPVELSCTFAVPVSLGVNVLTVTFRGDGRVVGQTQGWIGGGDLQWDAGFEILDATGRWTPIARDHAAALPATASTAVREVLTNTGTIPMRVDPAGDPAVAARCGTRILQPQQRLVCPWRGVRPARSLAGDFRRELRVVDAVGGIAEYEVRGGLTTFPGTFALGAPSVAVGQVVVVSATGLPTGGAFALQFRIDDAPTVSGTSITRNGHTRLSFPLPRGAIGPTRVDVVHDGITIASLPFEVTRVPRPPDAPPPAWPLLLLLLVPIAAVGLLMRRRRRRRGITGSPARPLADPYPDASPATPEPAAVRRP